MKTPLTGLSALLLASMGLHAQVEVSISDAKAYRQTGPEAHEYLAGNFSLNLTDGSAFIDCGPFPEFVAPNPLICPPGTNGFVTEGDLDGDGVRDDGFHYHFTSVTPAATILEALPQRCVLSAAPPSDLPRPAAGFVDNSFLIYHDYTGNLQEKPIVAYGLNRVYAASEAENRRQMREIVPGVYYYQFPSRNNPIVPVTIPVRIFPFIEAFPGRSVISGQTNVRSGFRLANQSWNNGAVEFDPMAPFLIRWDGVNLGELNASSDTLTFSIEDTGGAIIFPPFQDTVPAGIRVPFQFDDPRTAQYNLGPFLLPRTTDMEIVLTYSRNLPVSSNASATDTSLRQFRIPARTVNSFEGFLFSGFPAGTLLEDRTASGDLDGDGVSNLLEFALGTDVNDATSVFVPEGTVDPVTGFCTMTVPKVADLGSSMTYFIQASEDMQTWTTITASDPDWTLTDDVNQISVTSTAVRPTCFLRLRVVSHNINQL